MTDDSKQIEALTAKVNALERQLSGTDMGSEKDVGEWRNYVHQIREARATRAAAVGFSKADLAAMRAAAPDDVCRNIAMRDNRAPQGPCPPGPPSNVPTGPAVQRPVTTGWSEPRPLRPPEGIGYVDRLLELDSAKQRGQAMIEEAKRKALDPK